MVNKRVIFAGLLVAIVLLAVVVAISTEYPAKADDVQTPNIKSPPDVQPTTGQTTVNTLELSSETDGIECQQPPKGNEYGGISGKEDSPPKGTTISQELTVKYGRTTATGDCGTYWHIVGWWFNASEMAKLPSETLLYGVSPYAITEGSDGNGGQGDDEDKPVIPIPEAATIVLVTFGILAFVVWKRTKR